MVQLASQVAALLEKFTTQRCSIKICTTETKCNPNPDPTDLTKPHYLTVYVRCWVVNFSSSAACYQARVVNIRHICIFQLEQKWLCSSPEKKILAAHPCIYLLYCVETRMLHTFTFFSLSLLPDITLSVVTHSVKNLCQHLHCKVYTICQCWLVANSYQSFQLQIPLAALMCLGRLIARSQ